MTQEQIEQAARECDYRYQREEEAFVSGGLYVLDNLWIDVDVKLPEYNKAVLAMDYQPQLSWDDQCIIIAHRSKNPDVWKEVHFQGSLEMAQTKIK